MYITLQLIYTEAACSSGKWEETYVGVHSWTVENELDRLGNAREGEGEWVVGERAKPE